MSSCREVSEENTHNYLKRLFKNILLFQKNMCQRPDFLYMSTKTKYPYRLNERERNGNPLQHSGLENPVDRGAGGLLSIGSHRVGHDWSDLACMHAMEKEMATHSSVLAWRIPGIEEPGGLPPMGSHRVGHDWSDLAVAAVARSRAEFFIKLIELKSSDLLTLLGL